MTDPFPPSSPMSSRLRVPRWFAVLSTMAGAVLGVATNLYSAETRHILEASGRDFARSILPIIAPTLVASAVSAIAFWLLARRRQQVRIVSRSIEIGVDVLEVVDSDQDAVVGRTLHYLEAKRSTETLVVFLHGLGLDASDFQPYMVESRYHCVALTLYGFNVEERGSEYYQPISLASHVQLLGYALTHIKRQYPRKRIILVGFSFGADLILFLSEHASAALAELRPQQVMLLDPNVNNTTTTISSRLSLVGADWEVPQLVTLLNSAAGMAEFRYLCEYLHKITTKDCAQVRQHAAEVVAVWTEPSTDAFIDYLRRLSGSGLRTRVYLSSNHEGLFNRIVRDAKTKSLDTKDMACPRVKHFELIQPRFLKSALGPRA
jgi:pimeloyl-ACP methyl ester carboxylesterase